MFDIIPYDNTYQQEWDDFVEQSKNGTFMLRRGYMDYHSDRFVDSSLLLYTKGKLWAVFAANIDGKTMYAHQGLTYGGLIMSDKCTAADVLTAFTEINAYLHGKGIKTLVYKPIPHIYHRQASEEDLYALFRCGARLTARGLSSCIDLTQPLKWRQNRRTALNKAREEGVKVERTNDLTAFWPILTDTLRDCHGVKPVHSLEEMRLLMSRFPDNIVFYQAVSRTGEVLGGMLLYLTKQVVHSQYISANAKGKQCGAIDAIMHEVLKLDARYFDFGISTERGGEYLNESLIFQKEGFGGRGVCYDTYEVNVERKKLRIESEKLKS